LPFECQKIAKKLAIGNFGEKITIFGILWEKNGKFWAIFDIQMAIFRRVRSQGVDI